LLPMSSGGEDRDDSKKVAAAAATPARAAASSVSKPSSSTATTHHPAALPSLPSRDTMSDYPSGSPRKKMKVSLVDHTYHDYSQLEVTDDSDDTDPHISHRHPSSSQQQQQQHSQHRRGLQNFPAKLHMIVSSPQYRHIIHWMPHGRSWRILNKELLSTVVCPENFSHSNFDSFNR
jgi:hypothetical protein